MGNRYIRNTAILAKLETEYGTDAAPTEAANALLVSNVSINPLNAQNVSRDLIRPFLGGSEQLVGVANIEMSFDVEFAGSANARLTRASSSMSCVLPLSSSVTK